ncbi:GspH/FimT family pseudopilin [Ectopseudomonas mendocina]|uniref:Type II secretion system protein H n=1 Tax=Ectopseudomonas mendocina TaxID=300 RepID=A0ABZ2RDI5_ECTME
MKPKHSGFTLIELMITLALLAILLGIAVPAVRDFIVKQRVSSATNSLIMSLVFARSEAVKLNRDVRVIPATTAANGWNNGWCLGPVTIGTDCNHADVIRVFSANNDVQIASNTGSSPKIDFRRDGTVNHPTDTALKITADGLPANSESARCIRVSSQGRPEVRHILPAANCN